MTAPSIIGMGAYLPLLRLRRRAAVAALAWSGLAGGGTGRRSVAGWDEDAVSMAVEAARPAVAPGSHPRSVVFASTSAPFVERAHAGIVIDALALPRTTRSLDVANSRRCAVSTLASALGGGEDVLIVAGERRPTAPGGAQQLAWGDGAAAVRVGAGPGGARLLGGASLTHDFLDVYASREHPHPYAAEERFVREVAVGEILIPAVSAALRDAGIGAADIDAAVVHEPVPGRYRALAASIGLAAVVANTLERVTEGAGDLGAAHVLFGLALALATAEPGQRLLVVGSGGGCEALVLEVTGPTPGADTAVEALAEGQAFDDYVRFLSLTGSLELDWGPRSEVELKTSASTLHRHGRDAAGFIGGRDSSGNVQFPKSSDPRPPPAWRERWPMNGWRMSRLGSCRSPPTGSASRPTLPSTSA